MLPHFPSLNTGKHRRVVTKHFTNLSLWLSAEENAFISFLIYQVKADNTFKYSRHTINKLIQANKCAQAEYNETLSADDITVFSAKKAFSNLKEKGLMLKTNRRNVYMINPMLTYVVDVVSVKQYNELQKIYQYATADELVEYFSKLVAQYLESKKPNYTYGKGKNG